MTSYIYNMVDTWASGGGPYTSIKMNATDNDVGSASLLMDLQVGGASKVFVRKTGAIAVTPTNASGPTGSTEWLIFRSDVTATGIATASGGLGSASLGFFAGSTSAVQAVWSSGTILGNSAAFGWTALGSATAGGFDTLITRRGTANLRFGAADVGATTATVTITIAAPGVVTWVGHLLSTGTPVVFATTGALPTGITSGTTYYAVVVTDSTFQLATSVANAVASTPTVITTSGSQSGTHTGTRYNITQRLSMQSITGVTDRLGADMFIQGSQGTGTGPGGSIIFQVAPAGSTGTAQNALATALTIGADRNATFDVGVNTPVLRPTPGNDLIFNGASVGAAWRITTAGHFIAATDGLYDIGASGATRPRSIYVAADVYLGDSLRLANANLRSLTSGCIRLTNSAASDFDRLQFGGTTSSFPALKRSTTTLQVRLADDSAFATVQGKLRADVNAVAETPTATHTITITDAAGTAYKVLCVAA